MEIFFKIRGEDKFCSNSVIPIGISAHTNFMGEYTGCDSELHLHVHEK